MFTFERVSPPTHTHTHSDTVSEIPGEKYDWCVRLEVPK